MVEYKSKSVGQNVSVKKSDFPQLLNCLMAKMAPTMKTNAAAGFKKCGLRPLNRNTVLKMLSSLQNEENSQASEENSLLSDSFLNNLKEIRYPAEPPEKKSSKKKVTVAPSKSICIEDLETATETPSTERKEKIKNTRTSYASQSAIAGPSGIAEKQGQKEKKEM